MRQAKGRARTQVCDARPDLASESSNEKSASLLHSVFQLSIQLIILFQEGLPLAILISIEDDTWKKGGNGNTRHVTAAETLTNHRIYDYRESSKVGPRESRAKGRFHLHADTELGLNAVHPFGCTWIGDMWSFVVPCPSGPYKIPSLRDPKWVRFI